MLTSFSDSSRIVAALDAGAVGYLLKDADPEDVLDGVRAVSRGESPIDPKVARRLLSPGLSSGWGIRTLAAGQRPFDPIGYHTGTVWPHDGALIAHGLRRYGFDDQAINVIDQLAAAGAFFPLSRYPELWCGFSSEDVPVPVQYPVACRPQAWSSGAPLLMLRTYGGITARAPEGRLEIIRPRLPPWLTEIEIRDMKIGGTRLDLRFTRYEGVTAVQFVTMHEAQASDIGAWTVNVLRQSIKT